MNPARIEVVDDPPDGLRRRVGEELAADHDARLGRLLDLANQPAPGLDRRWLAEHDVGAPGRGHDRADRLGVRARVVDALLVHRRAARVEGGLQRGRAGLERTDVDEARALGDEERGVSGRCDHRRRRPTTLSLLPIAARPRRSSTPASCTVDSRTSASGSTDGRGT